MYEEPRSLLPFELVTDAEQPFTPNNIQGKWTLLFFGFSHCPDFCPTTLATLRSLVGQLDTDLQKNLQVVMVSVDPARDTPQRLREYFAGFQFNEENTDFVGVTGEFFHIKVLADQFYIPFQKKIIAAEPTDHSAHMSTHEGGDMTEHLMDKGEMDNSEHMGETANTENNYTMVHGESIVLINPQGQLQGFFSPPFTVSRLKTTLRSIITVYEKQ